jgi:selenide,water dikinase
VKLKILEGALNYAGIGLLPAATYDNEEYVGGSVVFPDGFNDDLKMLLFDPQTSGGLLISVPEEKLSELLEKLKERGELWSRVVGRITGGNRIEVR